MIGFLQNKDDLYCYTDNVYSHILLKLESVEKTSSWKVELLSVNFLNFQLVMFRRTDPGSQYNLFQRRKNGLLRNWYGNSYIWAIFFASNLGHFSNPLHRLSLNWLTAYTSYLQSCLHKTTNDCTHVCYDLQFMLWQLDIWTVWTRCVIKNTLAILQYCQYGMKYT